MLSHLRFHRRGPSNPASPLPDHHSTSPHASIILPSTTDALSSDSQPPSSNSPALPPTLPPIARVTSAESESTLEYQRNAGMAPQPDSRPQQSSKSPYTGTSSFIGGVALKKYRSAEGYNNDGADNTRGTSGNQSGPSRLPPQAVNNSRQSASFSTPTDLQNLAAAAPTGGRRPAGTRLHTEPPLLSVTTSNTQNPKPKKGLPFLKNPMSTLLMRRKNNHQVPDLSSLPLRKDPEEPMYDPRIKGTRVHDFSAPRSKKATAPSKDPSYMLSPSLSQPSPLPQQEKFINNRQASDASASAYSQDLQALKASASTSSDPTSGFTDATTHPPPPQYTPPVPPPYDESPISVQPRSSQSSRLIDDASSVYSRSSTKISSSRGLSLYTKDPSALPKHMKSTSSRFSFDMIGSANQEKLLEDRHRQREAEKKTAEPDAHRDSRFDDFDEDGFDYDAMMDDDGLEEPIPGVNADYDEDEYFEEEINMVGGDDDFDADLDPDNDQENFSGFVFQRSNPASSLASPHTAGLLITPRDADGNTIGYAMSKDSPRLPNSISPNLLTPQLNTNPDLQAAGLGIQGLDLPGPTQSEHEATFQQNQQRVPSNLPRSGKPDDLYFDDGMMGLEGNEFAEDLAAPPSPEWDDTPFDESIFDNNDTDQFGRPIAGAFAQAQAERRAAQEVVKRESDANCRLSALSGVSESTTHTSVSANGQNPVVEEEPKEISPLLSPEQSPVASKDGDPYGDPMAAYQAALAAAAHNAVLSGKFQRATSPSQDEVPASEVGLSSNTSDHGDFVDDDYDPYGYEDMADFELDDDAIIAEANASALANDSDGWYGQEFGFYSAPMGSHHGPQSATEFEYANGGFFGPKRGLDRSTSGRMVSREPNLTPITERSEYSNRNSLMSLHMPGFSSGTPLQSPGLAQLALLGDRGDEMSLSALMKLRSKAWGSSQVSLASSQGSPRSERGDIPSSPWTQAVSSPTGYHARKNSVLSTVSQDSEDDGSVTGSPTLTGFPVASSSPPAVPPLEDMRALISAATGSMSPHTDYGISPVAESGESSLSASGISPVDRHQSSGSSGSNVPSRLSGNGHRYKTSTESISYTQEEGSGETRWVLERRRTSELGQEILEREVVEGGRI
ncbi:hypothetical protein BGZ63DRAFT_366934 [Mariannaea sp. PMI_226]|nr:hypothetical protein BGZ63DRAFT_366934 [Mariannaea sp. PMI_226]